jgi:serine/threonine-protein kinase
VAGRPPFAGENPVSIAYKQVHENPQPLNQLVADVPKPFEAIVAKLLAKKPEIRYQTADEVRDELRRFRNGEPVKALVAVMGVGAAGVALGASATTAMPRTVAVPPAPGATSAMARTAMQQRQPVQQRPQQNRSGMYAVLGFLALIALVAGGIILFNVLSKDDKPTQFPMPNVVGMTLEEGVTVLQDAGLVPNAVEETNPAVAPGTIGRTDPIADVTVLRDQAVDVFFTAAVTPFPLDDMQGKSQQEAIDALALLGLTVDPTIITENNPNVPAGTVIRTDPPAGTTVQQGDVIKLVVSAGPNQVSVPPVEGLSQANAQALLESDAYGLVVTLQQEASSTVPAGQATRTDPVSGALANKGSAITLFVSSGPSKVRVPPLVGLTQAQAEAKLFELGLAADVQFQSVPAGDSTDGRVTAQTPSQSVEVDPGSTVRLKVAKALPAPTTTETPTTLAPTTTVAPTTVPATTAAPTTTSTTLAGP